MSFENQWQRIAAGPAMCKRRPIRLGPRSRPSLSLALTRPAADPESGAGPSGGVGVPPGIVAQVLFHAPAREPSLLADLSRSSAQGVRRGSGFRGAEFPRAACTSASGTAGIQTPGKGPRWFCSRPEAARGRRANSTVAQYASSGVIRQEIIAQGEKKIVEYYFISIG